MKKLLKIGLLIGAIYIFLQVNNQWIVTTELTYESEKVPAGFDGYRITQITDLHDAQFGENQERLVQKVAATEPDVIFITGDVIDSRRYDLERSMQAVRQLVDIADVYYVLGNHEVALNKMDEIYATLTEAGVHVLANDAVVIERGGDELAIVGIEDPLMGWPVSDMLDVALENVEADTFTLLLSHRPEQFDSYVAQQMDVVFTGHAHGGQVRLPFIGGLAAPTQGILPKYTAGVFEEDETYMIINRGLGNSIFPYRIFNLPEIIVLQLQGK